MVGSAGHEQEPVEDQRRGFEFACDAGLKDPAGRKLGDVGPIDFRQVGIAPAGIVLTIGQPGGRIALRCAEFLVRNVGPIQEQWQDPDKQDISHAGKHTTELL